MDDCNHSIVLPNYSIDIIVSYAILILYYSEVSGNCPLYSYTVILEYYSSKWSDLELAAEILNNNNRGSRGISTRNAIPRTQYIA